MPSPPPPHRGCRLVVIDQENMGQDRARKSGLDAATGELVMFVDNDDLMEPGAVNALYAAMKEHGADVTGGEINRLHPLGIKVRKAVRPAIMPYMGRAVRHEELMEKLYISFFGVNILSVTVWGKLFRKQLFDGWEPRGIKFGEDELMMIHIFPKIQTLYLIPDKVYCYRTGGLTSRYMPFFLDTCKWLHKLKRGELDRQHYEEGYKWLAIELKNELKFHVMQQLFYGKECGESWLAEELKDPVYDDFQRLLESGCQPRSAVDAAIYRRDAEQAWRLLRAEYKPWHPRTIAKRILQWVM